MARAPKGAACMPGREGKKQPTSTRAGKLLPRRAPQSLERERRRWPGSGPSPVLRVQAALTAVPHSAGRRAALPGAKVEGEVSRARPPHSRPRPPAFSRDATPPPPPLRPRGARPPPPPELFTPSGPSRRRRRLLSNPAPLPTRPPPPPPPQPDLSGASSSHRTQRNRDSSRAGRKLPRNCQGGTRRSEYERLFRH